MFMYRARDVRMDDTHQQVNDPNFVQCFVVIGHSSRHVAAPCDESLLIGRPT